MKSFLQRVLAVLARATLRRHHPVVVGITGSVGKTSTKEAAFAVLATRYRARRSEKNYNTEIGVPLTILGIRHQGANPIGWGLAVAFAVWRLLRPARRYPEALILEMGADRSGDIAYLAGLVRPSVGVITAIGDVPVHVEFFRGPRELALEKSKLIEALPPDGRAVLNADDPVVAALATRTRGRVITFGFGEGSSLRVTEYHLDAVPGASPTGIRFVLSHRGRAAEVRLADAFGRQQAYAAAAAVGVGIAFGMKLEEAAGALAAYRAPPGRLKLIPGLRGSLLLDDTYNASPAATAAALDVLAEFPAGRRIAVLGDMLELGAWSEAAHRAVGRRVAAVADVFIATGPRMALALGEAGKALGRPGRPRIALQAVPDAYAAGRRLAELLRPGDVALLKGSQGMRMERAVEAAMAEPQRAPELLVRQTVDWKQRP